MENKTIFFIATRWFGVLKNTELLRKIIIKNNYDIHVLGRKDNLYDKYKTENTIFHELRIKSSYFSFLSDFLDIAKIVYLILKFKPKVIHSFNPKPIMITYFAITFFKKIKFFSSQTGMGNLFTKNKFLFPIIFKLLKSVNDRSSSVFFYNKFDAKFLRSNNLISTKKIIYVGPYVNVKDFFLKKDRNKKDFIRVICISRLLKQKGVIEFIEVAKRYKEDKKKRKVIFLLVGEFEYTHDDRISEEFINNAVNKKIIDRVGFTKNIKKLLHKSDILFLHSYREGAPSVIVEASAAKMPTIGSDAIGVKDLIINGKTGFTSKARNVDLAYKSLLKLVNNKKLIKKLGNNAYEKIAKPVNIEESTMKQVKAYNRDTTLLN